MPRERLIVALDLPSLRQAEELADRLAGEVGLFKIGLELFHAEGPRALLRLRDKAGGVFYDCKLHDIPNTIAAAVRRIVPLGVRMLNLHSLAGKAGLAAAREAAEQAAAEAGLVRPRLLGVTLLTSLSPEALREELGIALPLERQVRRLARLCREAGLDGVVASAQEAAAIKADCGRDFLVVCPGIRPAREMAGDQKRIATPAEAIAAGADYLVVGRPITGAPDPVAAARRLVAEIRQALG
jgi:orotidine-5'-phosphate decarboxylase